jgi:hypothetical protein
MKVMIRSAKREAYEQTEEFKDHYRWRACFEANMSEYGRRIGVNHLRIRGFKAVRFCTTLKAFGVNNFRSTGVQKTDSSNNAAQGSIVSGRMHAVSDTNNLNNEISRDL